MTTDGAREGDEWYEHWLELHCKAMGVDGSQPTGQAVIDVFVTNRSVVLDHWKATGAELGECTARIAARNETPRFPNEHLGAVGTMLIAIREERDRPPLAPLPPPEERACWQCHGLGVVVIPHPSCVWEGRLIIGPLGYFTTTVALCDRPGCEAGERELLLEQRRDETRIRPGRIPKLMGVKRRLGCDVVALMRDYEEQQRARLRDANRTDTNWQTLRDSLARKFAEGLAKEPKKVFL